MKHYYKRFRLAFIGLALVLASGFAQAQNFDLVVTQQIATPLTTPIQVRYLVQLRNNTGAGAAPVNFEYADFVLGINTATLSVSSPTIVPGSAGPWDPSRTPGEYEPIAVRPFATDGTNNDAVVIQIRSSASGTTGFAQPANGTLVNIVEFSLPVSNCEGFTNTSYLSAFSSAFAKTTNAALNPSNVTVPPNISVKPVLSGTLPTVTGLTQPGYCSNTPITINVNQGAITGGTPNTFRIFTGGASGPGTQVGAGAPPISGTPSSLGITGETFVWTQFNVFGCTYESARVPVRVDEPITVQARPSGPSDVCTSTPAPSAYGVAIDPTTLEYQWQVQKVNGNLPSTSFTDRTIALIGAAPYTANISINWNQFDANPTAADTGLYQIRVRTRNYCGFGPFAVYYVRVHKNAPTKPSRPVFNTRVAAPNPPYTGAMPICITDRRKDTVRLPISQLRFPLNTTSYEWALSPDTMGTIANGFNTTFPDDTLRAVITWNRIAQGNTAWVKVRARNACGIGPWSDSIQFTLNLLPHKPAYVRTVANIDTICKGSPPTRFVTQVIVGRDRLAPSGRRYRWFVEPEPNALYPPTGGSPLATNFPVDSLYTQDSIATVRWNPNYTGFVKIYAAARSTACEFDTNYTTLGQPDYTSGWGDVQSMIFFIRPTPLRPATPRLSQGLPDGLCVGAAATPTLGNIAGRTISFRSDTGRYAKTYVWYLTDSLGRPRPGLGSFVSSTTVTADSAQFTFSNAITTGWYFVRVYGINDCGIGDTSAPYRFRISNQAPTRIDSITQWTFRPDLAQIPNDTLNANPFFRRSFCKAAPTTILSVGSYFRTTLAPTLARANAIAYKDSASAYIWRVIPDTAGTIQGFGGGPVNSPIIQIAWNPNFSGIATVCVAPVNGCNYTGISGNYSSLQACLEFRIFERPRGFAGPSVATTTNAPMIMGGSGGGLFPNFPATYQGASPLNRVRFDWTFVGNPPGISRNTSAPFSLLNPEVTATAPGSYTLELVMFEPNYCRNDASLPIRANIVVSEAYNINTPVLLQGPLSGATMTPRFSTTNTVATLPGGPYTILDSVYRRREVTVANPRLFMNPGFGHPTNAIDIVDFLVVSDTNTIGSSTIQGEGRAFLMPDGTLRDFQTGQSQFVRILPTIPSANLAGQDFYVVSVHRNHLSLVSRVQARPTAPTGTPGATAATGFLDLRTPANILRRPSQGVNHINRYHIAGTRVAMAAGNLTRSIPIEIDTRDFLTIQQLLITGARSAPYSINDVNLDGQINAADLNLVDANNRLLLSSFFQR